MNARVKPVMSESDYAAKMDKKSLTPDGGSFIPDPTPMAPPLGYIRQPSITERIRDMVRSEHLRQAAEAAGNETFEEADDFDVGDDFDPNSPYEEQFEGQFSEPLPAKSPSRTSTGVPMPPSGGTGEGAEGGKSTPASAGDDELFEPETPPKAQKAAPASPPAGAAPKAPKRPPGAF